MRISGAGSGWVMSAASVLLLAACADSPVAPVPPQEAFTSTASCTGGVSTRAGGAQSPGGGVSLNWGQPIAGVTVWARYSGASFGIPFNLGQQMNFGGNMDVRLLPCIEAEGESFSVTATTEVADPLPAPDGVDPSWWGRLSPREQRVLLTWAEAIMKQYPGAYRSVGAVISEMFGNNVDRLKTQARIRARDFLADQQEADLFAGAIYGCLLYQRYSRDPNAPFSGSEVLEMSTALTGALGEAQFATRPLRGVRFGRNGAFGAGLAAADGYGGDCGWLAFRSIGGAILVNDPYAIGNGAVPPGGGGGEDR
jgi:hypothetical protein